MGAAAMMAGGAAAGSVLNAYGQIRSSQEQAGALRFNARQSMIDARSAQREGEGAMEMKVRQLRQVLGAQRAAVGISGFTGTGSIAQIAGDTARAGMFDALALKYGGESKAARLRNEANMGRHRARATIQAGYVSAASSLLSGASTAGSQYMRQPPA